MKKLSFIASLSGLLLVATLGASLLSAGPALAQGGGNKPVSDVRVVNTSTEAVPVRVNSLPAVQVGNTNGNPVPVAVTNPPAASSKELWQQNVDVTIQGNSGFTTVSAITVPSGKRLVVTRATWLTSAENHQVGLLIHNTVTRVYMGSEVRGITDYGNEEVQFTVGPGQTLDVIAIRPNILPSGHDVTVFLSGYFENAN